jgi:hypothetical protein
MATVAAIDQGEAGTLVSQGLDLLEGVGEGVTVVGVPGMARLPTTKPFVKVMAMLTLIRNL